VFFAKASELAPANFKDQIKQLATGNPTPTTAPKKASPSPEASPK
jgi:hypothetical protein